MSEPDAEYDIIIVGGGAAGGVIAGRLANADSSLRILILEAGPHTLNKKEHVQPGLYRTHLVPNSSTVRFYRSTPSEHTAGRELIIPTGACVGGGSSVNYCIYTRAAASDYDNWEERFANPGWGSNSLIPLLRKTENYQIRNGSGSSHVYGQDGPLKVSYGGVYTNVGEETLKVISGYDKIHPVVEDLNALTNNNGYSHLPKWIDDVTGKRSDVAHHYIYNQSGNHNLRIRAGSLVHRVVFEGSRAVGVEYSLHDRFHHSAQKQILVVRATKCVVLSVGALGTPQILERSRVGQQAVLEALNITQRVELAGVGENYQDHPTLFQPYLASEDVQNLVGSLSHQTESKRMFGLLGRTLIDKWDGNFSSQASPSYLHVHMYYSLTFTSSGADVGGKFRPDAADLLALGPDFRQRWDDYYKDALDKPVAFMGVLSSHVGNLDPSYNYFSTAIYIQHPMSTGSIHITSNDPLSDLELHPGSLASKDDLAVLKWGLNTHASGQGACDIIEANMLQTTRHLRGPLLYMPGNAQDQLTLPIPTWNGMRRTTGCLNNTSGGPFSVLAPWKPRQEGGVVDPSLNVYGTQSLKCADLSICPANVSANTYPTALLIGEKAAAIIAAELGIELDAE